MPSTLFSRLLACDKDVRDLYGTVVAVVGPKTAEALHKYGLNADLQAKDFRAEGILAELQKEGVVGKSILYPMPSSLAISSPEN